METACRKLASLKDLGQTAIQGSALPPAVLPIQGMLHAYHGHNGKMCSSLLIACTQLAHRLADCTAKERAQRYLALITHLAGNQINAVTACTQ